MVEESEVQLSLGARATVPPEVRESDVLDRIARADVFFGHQSVGEDVLAGIRGLVAPRQLAWRDEKIGRNGDPFGKLDAFEAALLAGSGKGAHFAIFKFCYADFDGVREPEEIFSRYERTISRLHDACPAVTFVHVTSPLTSVPSGLGAWVRRRVGRPVWGERGNRRRHAYNQRLRTVFRADPIFDLAAVEEGACHRTTVPSLDPCLTDDGAHLNQIGRLAAATELVRVLVDLTSIPERGHLGFKSVDP
jgi:hypothetical protein